jgi:hypothetical protein
MPEIFIVRKGQPCLKVNEKCKTCMHIAYCSHHNPTVMKQEEELQGIAWRVWDCIGDGGQAIPFSFRTHGRWVCCGTGKHVAPDDSWASRKWCDVCHNSYVDLGENDVLVYEKSVEAGEEEWKNAGDFFQTYAEHGSDVCAECVEASGTGLPLVNCGSCDHCGAVACPHCGSTDTEPYIFPLGDIKGEPRGQVVELWHCKACQGKDWSESEPFIPSTGDHQTNQLSEMMVCMEEQRPGSTLAREEGTLEDIPWELYLYRAWRASEKVPGSTPTLGLFRKDVYGTMKHIEFHEKMQEGIDYIDGFEYGSGSFRFVEACMRYTKVFKAQEREWLFAVAKKGIVDMIDLMARVKSIDEDKRFANHVYHFIGNYKKGRIAQPSWTYREFCGLITDKTECSEECQAFRWGECMGNGKLTGRIVNEVPV